MNSQHGAQRGFTLVELMIVIVILGIISAIAVGTFTASGQDTRRVRAQADLQALADAASRYYQARFTYEDATAAGLAASAQLSLDLDNYAYEFVPLNDGQQFVVVARPVAGSSQAGDGAFAMTSQGGRCYYKEDDDPDLEAPCPNAL
jgi:prepilin-type N-terminal cleavage/methylation domain-containing protein